VLARFVGSERIPTMVMRSRYWKDVSSAVGYSAAGRE
jgi:hypothetical protein